MDAARFDRFTRALFARQTRRAMFGLGAVGLLGALGLDDADAKKKKGKNKKCKKCGPCQKCKKGKCKPKAAGTPCGPGQQCFANGECRACDVCLGDCSFTSLQDAVNAASRGTETTIRICPGRYPTNAVIDKNVTLIGAGSGVGGTVLDGQKRGRVVDIASFNPGVTMRNLTITGGSADRGAGIQTESVTLMLEDVHLSDNHSSGNGGAMYVIRGGTTLSNCRISGNSAANGGGIFSGGVQGGYNTLRLRDHSIVTENTATATGGNDGQGAGGIFNANPSYSTVEISEGSQVTGNTPVDCLGTTAC